jgi:hypothetical protein
MDGGLTLSVDEVHDPLKGCDLTILPQTGILGRDATLGNDGGGFKADRSDATHSQGLKRSGRDRQPTSRSGVMIKNETHSEVLDVNRITGRRTLRQLVPPQVRQP